MKSPHEDTKEEIYAPRNAERALEDGILTPPDAKDTRTVCPACKNVVGMVAICTVCGGKGEVIMREQPNRVTEFLTLDGVKTYSLPTSLVESKKFQPSKEQLDAVASHLQRILIIISHARIGHTEYRVPVKHRSGIDGELEETVMRSWGRNAQEAAYNATYNAQRMQWAEVSGKVEPLTTTPNFTPEWLASVLAIAIP